jgi:hypothetical protein
MKKTENFRGVCNKDAENFRIRKEKKAERDFAFWGLFDVSLSLCAQLNRSSKFKLT